jgi:hypothetical protein
MADEGSGVAIPGRNVDLLVDHGMLLAGRFDVSWFLGLTARYDYKETAT